MGCGTAREKLEDEMMVYKLERMAIQMEKEKELKKLAEIEGHPIERSQIPDYIDPQFAKEKRLYIDPNENKDENKNNNNNNDNNDNNNDNISIKRKKTNKKILDNENGKKKKKKK